MSVEVPQLDYGTTELNIRPFWSLYSQPYNISKEGRVELIEFIKLLLSSGLIFGVCYIVTVVAKCIVAHMIIHSNSTSDDKVKYLTKMMSKDININLPINSK